jgi:hypothetical protein
MVKGMLKSKHFLFNHKENILLQMNMILKNSSSPLTFKLLFNFLFSWVQNCLGCRKQNIHVIHAIVD